jgi:RNA polymerase sigma-70 factor (ECF subfamily)
MGTIEFHQILVSNLSYLKPFANTLTRDQEKARDLLQETMYRALVYKEKYNFGTNMKAWLYTIMRNIFINDYRKQSKQQIIHNKTTEEFLLNSSANAVVNNAIGLIHLKEMQTAVQKLPRIFKIPFQLYLDGYKYQEIAKALQEPLGTIKSRIFFARKLLVQTIGKQEAFGLGPNSNTIY